MNETLHKVYEDKVNFTKKILTIALTILKLF